MKFSKDTTVETLMQPAPRCIYPHDTLASINEIFKERQFHHLPVVDEDGQIIGIVSEADIKNALEQIARNSSGKEYTRQIMQHWTAARIMTHNPTFLNPEDTIGKAALYFLNNKFHALPILNTENDLVGIITSHDLLKYAYQ